MASIWNILKKGGVALGLGLASIGITGPQASAAPIAIVNHSFEADPNTFNEFYFGDPTGWTSIDPGGILDGGLGVQGTLTVTGSNYFGGVAPDGNNVAILFLGGNDVGTGQEVGLGQVLTTDLAANTQYTLSVDVGNIDSGTAQNGTFFDLSGFPGYRIELLAGGVLLDSLTEGIDAAIGEGEFALRQLTFITGDSVLANQALEIRLFNLNLSDPAFPDPGVDLEVDFDNVRLDATAVAMPKPGALALLAIGLGWLGFAGPGFARRKQPARHEAV